MFDKERVKKIREEARRYGDGDGPATLYMNEMVTASTIALNALIIGVLIGSTFWWIMFLNIAVILFIVALRWSGAHYLWSIIRYEVLTKVSMDEVERALVTNGRGKY